MIIVTVHIINAFVAANEGGNPAAVVLDADDLNEAQKQSIAASLGLSEAAFVSQSSVSDYKLDFFTPTRRIAHCGHATIATFAHLASSGRLSKRESSKETIDGPRKIIIDDDQAFMEQLAPSYIAPDQWGNNVHVDDVLDSLGITSKDLVAGHAPMIVSTGNRFMIIPLDSQAVLSSLDVNQDLIQRISEKLDLIGYFAFVRNDLATDYVAIARMFAPHYGIPEEAATGMAAGPLACYLWDYMEVKSSTMLIEQGRFMSPPSPSRIEVRLTVDNGVISQLMVGGSAKVTEVRTLTI